MRAKLVAVLDVVQERGRVGRALQEVVQPLRAVAHPEHRAELAEAPRRQPVARREPHVLLGEAGVNRAHALEIVRVARIEAPVALAHALVRRAVDVVRRPGDRRDPARDECLTQRLRRDRQVRAHAEAAEALPEDAPALDAELLTDQLRVAHDRVGAVQLEVRSLLLRALARQRADGSRTAGAALVEQENAVVLQRARQPARRLRIGRPRRLVARPALEKDEDGPLAAVLGRDLAREDDDALAVRPRVVERQGELVVGENEAADAARHCLGYSTARYLSISHCESWTRYSSHSFRFSST